MSFNTTKGRRFLEIASKIHEKNPQISRNNYKNPRKNPHISRNSFKNPRKSSTFLSNNHTNKFLHCWLDYCSIATITMIVKFHGLSWFLVSLPPENIEFYHNHRVFPPPNVNLLKVYTRELNEIDSQVNF